MPEVDLHDLLDFGDIEHLHVVLFCACAIGLVWMCSSVLWHAQRSPARRSAAILVLGDIGRSPRMMYHAHSLSQSGFETYVVGFEGATPIASLLTQPRVRFCYLHELPRGLRSLPFIVFAPMKIVHQVWSILYTFLARIPSPPEYIVVQNPPSIPTLALVWLIAAWTGSKVIIDWHNLGYTILALKLGERHLLVRVARLFEAFFGRSAYAHLFVTHAMHDHLVAEWGLQGHKAVLHDRPPAHFHRATSAEVHDLFLHLDESISSQSQMEAFLPHFMHPYSTTLTRVEDSNGQSPSQTATSANVAPLSISRNIPSPDVEPVKRADRPALVVSSTSWTPDEDFSILFDSLSRYEQRARTVNTDKPGTLPKLLCIVTGKGPLKESYMKKVHRAQAGANGDKAWEWVRCVNLWLEPEDYPLLLGSADLGVSLHSSSSALDLPMKIVDMFGCGLPVCALDFACLPELVKEGQNGLIFTSSEQLAKQFEALFTSFPHCPTLEGLRGGLGIAKSDKEQGWGSWDDNWDHVVRPLLMYNTSYVT